MVGDGAQHEASQRVGPFLCSTSFQQHSDQGMILDGWGTASSPLSQPHVNDRCGSTQTFRPGCTGPAVLSLSEIGLSVHAMGTSRTNHPAMKEPVPSCWRDVVRETWTHSTGGSSSKQPKREGGHTHDSHLHRVCKPSCGWLVDINERGAI